MVMPINRKPIALDYVEGIDELIGSLVHTGDLTEFITSPGKPTDFLALMIEDYLELHGMSREALAERMDCEPRILDAILTGRVPADKFDAGLVEKIGAAIECEPSTIALMLGRETAADPKQVVQNKEQEAREYLNAISNVLFEALDMRYQKGIQHDPNRQREYDEVIKKLEEIIAKQRRDLRFVESLKAKLENPENSVLMPVDDSPRQPTILRMKENLRRIVEQLEGQHHAGVG